MSALFKKYENVKGVSTVYISKSLLGLVPKLEAGDMDISAIASKLDHVQVLTCERPSLIKEIKATAMEILSKGGYNNLMTVRDGDELTIVYGKQLGKGKNELVLLEVEKNDITMAAHVDISRTEDPAPAKWAALPARRTPRPTPMPLLCPSRFPLMCAPTRNRAWPNRIRHP